MAGKPWHGRKRALTDAQRAKRYRKLRKLERGSKFHSGSGENGLHYWLTPSELYASLDAQYHFDFDPCPWPLPDGFDGLTCEWGQSNYVNPPFGPIVRKGKVVGLTAWARKAIEAQRQGKRVVLVYPFDRWVLELIEAGATLRNLGGVQWCATEDGSASRGSGQHVAAFVLEPAPTTPS